MASLTEAARQVLMKEGMIPSVSSSQSDPDAGAKAMNPNSATLRPGSRGIEPRFANPNAPEEGEFDQYEDLGGPVTSATDPNPYAKINAKKDKSKSSASPVGQEPMKTQGQGVMAEANYEIKKGKEGKPMRDAFAARKDPEMTLAKAKKMTDKPKSKKEEMDEEFEISEELEAFIEEMVEEGYSDEEIAEAIDENFELVEEKDEEDEEDEKKEMKEARINGDYLTADKEEAEKATSAQKRKIADANKKPVPKTPTIKEHVDALLAGENLSEDFREKAETIFESAVSTRVQEEVAVLEEAYAKSLEEEVTQIHEQLIEQVDSYLNYVVEQWVSENEVAIESGLRSELTEEFISGLRNLFAEHYIDVPEEKVDMLEQFASKLEKVETRLNEEIERNVSLTQMINESKQTEILFSAFDGLTTTQAAKLRSLAENITFTTPAEYNQKIQTLKESYFNKSVNSSQVLDEAYTDNNSMITENLNGPMANYVKAIGKTIK
jgi:hypothetical protein